MSPSPAFPDPLVRFVRLFNRGAFWASHEALEDAWREHRSPFYHGLILVASAFVHVRRRNRHGVDAQLDKAARALRGVGPSYLGIDVAALLREAERFRGLSDPLPDAYPVIRLDPRRVTGREPEAT